MFFVRSTSLQRSIPWLSAVIFLLTTLSASGTGTLIPCPGQVESDASYTQSLIDSGIFSVAATTCACNVAVGYTVDPGYFKLNASSPPVPCNKGSYCPGNMTQPAFCCEGYVCSEDTLTMTPCEEGYFCPPQSIKKIECGPLSVCPARTTKIEKYGAILGTFFIILVLVICSFLYHSYLDKKELYYSERIKAADEMIETRRIDAALMSKNAKSTVDEKAFEMKSPAANLLNEPRLSIKFKDLEYTLPDGLTIMSGVTGEFKRGRLVAVMGPSGAGKSTLFNLITGKAKRTGGQIFVRRTSCSPDSKEILEVENEEEVSTYKQLIGFVPQDDIMLRNMTVTDILTFSAHRRLPASMTMKEKDEVVAEIISTLEISHIANSIIGDERRRGISGGQRKRVNIGMELVAKPAVLFLDEPTTGLDSSTAKEVCSMLRELCHTQQLTAAAVIHSPSIPTINQFDDLCLLGKGGQLIYFGPLKRARAYFEDTLGYKMPPKTNPADFYLEIAMGKVQSKKLPGVHWAALFELWKAHTDASDDEKTGSDEYKKAMDSAIAKVVKATQERQQSRLEEKKKKGDENKEEEDCCSRHCSGLQSFFYKLYKNVTYDFYMYWFSDSDGVCTELYHWIVSIFCGPCAKCCQCARNCYPTPVREAPNAFVIFWLCFKRAIKQSYSDPIAFAEQQILFIGVGLFLAVSANELVYVGSIEPIVCQVLSPAGMITDCAQPVKDGYVGTANFLCFATGFAGIAAGSITFGAERVVYFRHASTGLDGLPYFFAKMIADLPRIVVAGTLTALMMFAQFYTVGNVGHFYGIVYALYMVSFSQGYFLTMIVDYDYVPLVGVVFTMFWCMIFSGINIRLTERSTMPVIQQKLFQLSAPRWAIEAFYINEMSFYYTYLDISARLAYYDYDIDNLPTDIGAMFFISIFWQGLAILMMKLLSRSKMK